MLLGRMGKSTHGKSRHGSFEVETAVILLCSDEQPGCSVMSNLSAVGCFVSLFHVPDQLRCFKWEKREELFCTEQGWIQALRFWCADEEGKHVVLFPCSFLHSCDNYEQLKVQLLSSTHMMIACWDSLSDFLIKCL